MGADSEGAPVVELTGELDAFVAPALRARLDEAIDAAGPGLVIVDLSQVTFLDSTALGTLVGALRRMRERGGELRVVLPPPPALRIFELTGLDAVFGGETPP